MERYPAAVLSYDEVSYSIAMGRDEVGTLQRLKTDHRDIIELAAERRAGRTIKLMGDGALIEFARGLIVCQTGFWAPT